MATQRGFISSQPICPGCGEPVEADDGTAEGDAVYHYTCLLSDLDSIYGDEE